MHWSAESTSVGRVLYSYYTLNVGDRWTAQSMWWGFDIFQTYAPTWWERAWPIVKPVLCGACGIGGTVAMGTMALTN